MMTPQRLSFELSMNATPSHPCRRGPSLTLCVLGLLGALACTGTIDDNPQTSRLLPNGRNSGTAGASAGSADPAARAPGINTGASGDGEQVGGNISGLDDDSADAPRSGGVRRRASGRDREDQEENEDAGVDEPLDDAGVLVDAGVIDGGVLEDGGLAADATAP